MVKSIREVPSVDSRIALEKAQAKRERFLVLWLMAVVTLGSCGRAFLGHRQFPYFCSGQQNETQWHLYDKVNPNTASWASLARLPGIGRVRSQAIVAYRYECRQDEKYGKKVFNEPGDLTKVKGIGPITVANVKEYICCDGP